MVVFTEVVVLEDEACSHSFQVEELEATAAALAMATRPAAAMNDLILILVLFCWFCLNERLWSES